MERRLTVSEVEEMWDSFKLKVISLDPANKAEAIRALNYGYFFERGIQPQVKSSRRDVHMAHINASMINLGVRLSECCEVAREPLYNSVVRSLSYNNGRA